MRIKNETGEEIIIEPDGELVVRRHMLWIDDEREIDYISISRVKGQDISSARKSSDKKESLSEEVQEMVDKADIPKNRDKRDEGERGGSEKPDEVINTQIKGTQCPSCDRDDFDDKRAVRSHHWRVHGAVIREWEYPCPKDGCKGGSNSMKGLKQHYARTHGERYDDVYGDKSEPEFHCHYMKNGDRCDHPCKNLRGLKIHWGKEHKDKEFYLPETEGQ